MDIYASFPPGEGFPSVPDEPRAARAPYSATDAGDWAPIIADTALTIALERPATPAQATTSPMYIEGLDSAESLESARQRFPEHFRWQVITRKNEDLWTRRAEGLCSRICGVTRPLLSSRRTPSATTSTIATR